jgi:outer membrane receptor protein involved in Fe transport
MGIYFFTMGDGGAYDQIKILHNTLWNVGTTPVWFRAPNNTPSGCEMKNNFIYVDGTIEFSPKSSWSLGYNYYYNTYNVLPFIQILLQNQLKLWI